MPVRFRPPAPIHIYQSQARLCNEAWLPIRRKIALSECVSIGYTPSMSGKDSGLRIRVEKALRDEFLEACHEQDRPASQVIREFMRDYIARNTDKETGKVIKVRPSGKPDRR